jgi:hypothetical protein
MKSVGERYIGPEKDGRSVRVQNCVTAMPVVPVRQEMLLEIPHEDDRHVGHVPSKTFFRETEGKRPVGRPKHRQG